MSNDGMIDAVVDEWDTWTGHSPDAMRWTPDTHTGVAEGSLAADWEALRLVIEQVARINARASAATDEPVTPTRRTHTPPMWAVQPNRERRRRR